MTRRGRGFSLIELMVVVALVMTLAAFSMPAFGLNGARRFSLSMGEIVSVLEQARSTAVAQNTHVWVVFYPVATADNNGNGESLCIGTFTSDDGGNPFSWNNMQWTGAVTIPQGAVSATAAGTTTTIRPLNRPMTFRQIALRTEDCFIQGNGDNQIETLPSTMPGTLVTPAASPVFGITVRGPKATMQLPEGIPSGGRTAQPLSVILFTPRGAARVSNSPIDAVWINFHNVKGRDTIDNRNIAAIKINGLTGLSTLYLK